MSIISDQPVTTEDMVLSNVAFDEAFVRVPPRRGLITEQEMVDVIQCPSAKICLPPTLDI
jgi:hypothetical protein